MEENNNIPEEKVKQKNTRKTVSLVVMIVSGLIFIAAATVLALKSFPSKDYEKNINEDPAKFVSSHTSKDELPDNPIDFAALKEKNSDICAFITIEDTVINNPVLQSSEDEPEDFYLEHDSEKNAKFSGSIYIQKISSADFSDTCTLVYGHNRRAGTEMFSELHLFRDEEFFNKHPNIIICTPGHVYTYRIFSAFTYDSRHILYAFNFSQQKEYEAFVNDCLNPTSMRKKYIREDAAPKWNEGNPDKILVLSTCTDTYSDDLRYIVCAKLVDDIKTK